MLTLFCFSSCGATFGTISFKTTCWATRSPWICSMSKYVFWVRVSATFLLHPSIFLFFLLLLRLIFLHTHTHTHTHTRTHTYTQASAEIKRGNVKPDDRALSTLSTLKDRGAKDEYLKALADIPDHGCEFFGLVETDFPKPGSKMACCVGNNCIKVCVCVCVCVCSCVCSCVCVCGYKFFNSVETAEERKKTKRVSDFGDGIFKCRVVLRRGRSQWMYFGHAGPILRIQEHVSDI